MNRLRSILLLPLLAVLAGAAENPRVFSLPAANLVAARDLLARGDPALRPALAELRRQADADLRLAPASVLEKSDVAASGDKHDYFSYGPYWWPDPAKPDGLPYLRRDGAVNPASRQGTDKVAFGRTCSAIETLGLAYFFTGHEPYATQAARLARVWFLDPATRMNPNLEHAQAVPGLNTGRGIGLIEGRGLAGVTDGLALLDPSPAWTASDRAAFTRWLSDYYLWATTSAHGREEQNELNNHGTWYDVQVAHLALALGRTHDARTILTSGRQRRLAAQVEPDGAQPRELARTKSLGYSLFNLEALFACARLGESVNVDWWNYVTPDGRSLRAALGYLAPYIDPAQPWPKADLEAGDRSRLLPLFVAYLAHRDDPDIRALFVKFSPTVDPNARWRLMWPASAAATK